MSSLIIKENEPLYRYTSFRIGGPARYFVTLSDPGQLPAIMTWVKEKKLPWFILGGGSNLLISDQGYDGIVLQINFKGLKLATIDNTTVELRVGAGEVWDEVVQFAVSHNLWGIENLSHIPGLSGGVPVQNVGAYGQEVSQVIKEVYVYDIATDKNIVLNNNECQFGYRRSIFNTTQVGKFIITGLSMLLTTKHQSNLLYKDLAEYFVDKDPTLSQIREAIILIRDKKLPHPQDIGSAGSFFKNLELSIDQYNQLATRVKDKLGKEKYQALMEIKREIPGGYKIPTAFVIDNLLNLKSLQIGGAKIYEHQALVIINYTGQAKATDVLAIFKQVRTKAKKLLNVEILPEPNLVGFSQEELKYYFSF